MWAGTMWSNMSRQSVYGVANTTVTVLPPWLGGDRGHVPVAERGGHLVGLAVDVDPVAPLRLPGVDEVVGGDRHAVGPHGLAD